MPEEWRRGYTFDSQVAEQPNATPVPPKGSSFVVERMDRERKEVLAIGRVVGPHIDGKYWVLLAKKYRFAYKNGVELSKGDIAQLPRRIPGVIRGRILVPVAQVPSSWRQGQFVVFNSQLEESRTRQESPDEPDFYVDGVRPWDHPLIQILGPTSR